MINELDQCQIYHICTDIFCPLTVVMNVEYGMFKLVTCLKPNLCYQKRFKGRLTLNPAFPLLGGGGGGGGGGGVRRAAPFRPAPGNPDDKWEHDMFEDGPTQAKRGRMATGMASDGLASS